MTTATTPAAVVAEEERLALAERRRAAHAEIARAQAAHDLDFPVAQAFAERTSAEATAARAEAERLEKIAMQAGATRLAVQNRFRAAKEKAEKELRLAVDPVISLARQVVYERFAAADRIPAKADPKATLAARIDLRRRLAAMDRLHLQNLTLEQLDAALVELCDFPPLPSSPK